jgi:hypothetical protein
VAKPALHPEPLAHVARVDHVPVQRGVLLVRPDALEPDPAPVGVAEPELDRLRRLRWRLDHLPVEVPDHRPLLGMDVLEGRVPRDFALPVPQDVLDRGALVTDGPLVVHHGDDVRGVGHERGQLLDGVRLEVRHGVLSGTVGPVVT